MFGLYNVSSKSWNPLPQLVLHVPMAFFGLPERDLLGGSGTDPDEDVAVYTWGEESYDGLGDVLQEGGDDLNDETFGTSGPIGTYLLYESP